MLPYIIINGVSSKTIPGLIIQSLPPITKPPIRTTVEEIDGRDGDVIEVLGYGAYDKEIEIGLAGAYNVDDIISFFQQSGKITFSNELDKYYNFATYEQIDFERLLRFKTATVKIHVQPFKMASNETAIDKSYTDTSRATLNIRNNGNIYSKPSIAIVGQLVVYIYINDTEVLSIDFGTTGGYIKIDPTTMNAFDGSGNLKNRATVGSYNDIKFEPGVNELVVSGNISRVVVDNYTRWL